MPQAPEQPTAYRVVCPAGTHQAASERAALDLRLDLEATGRCCRDLHTVQALVAGTWTPLHLYRARVILSSSPGTTIETVDGPLILAQGSWRAAIAAPLGAQAAMARADLPTLRTMLGPYETAILTVDGRPAYTTRWCHGGGCASFDEAVRYERWTAAGRVSHGYVCRSCRHLVQSG